MVEQLPAIIVTTPLLAALLVSLLTLWRKGFAFPVALLGFGVTLAATVAMMVEVVRDADHKIVYFLGGWKFAADGQSPIGIQLAVDPLSGLVLIAIAVVAFLVAIFSFRYAPGQEEGKVPQYYILSLLLTTGLLGMTIAADAFNLFVLLEVSSLTSYGLIAMGRSHRGAVASFNYVIMGTIGASFYLLGVGYLYAATGSLNMEHIREILHGGEQELLKTTTVMVAFVLIMLGLMIKMAFFPLHGWLLNAYSYSPSASSCVLAPLVTKVSVYVMIRMILTVFGPEYVFTAEPLHHVVVWLAVVAIVAGSVLALAQKEFKRMLCYLIVAEVGYMVGGVWLANHWGMAGAAYHILSDAFMTLCLFLAASMIWRKLADELQQTHPDSPLSRKERNGCASFDALDGILKKMPLTMIGLIVGAFAMIGVPPTCGFFSKWYLIRGGIESGHWEYVVALLFSSLVNAILFFRIIEAAYFGKKPAEGHGDGHHVTKPVKIDEAPLSALIALLASAAMLIVIGVFNSKIVEYIGWALEGAPLVGKN